MMQGPISGHRPAVVRVSKASFTPLAQIVDITLVFMQIDSFEANNNKGATFA